ncbi:nitroreductase [Chelatococcus asaccharovorans]|uniref:nitroreductase n=1 Tax=Chelatococcus asaccharovorans TaxID=28210 RepID=UPI00224C7B80|nr:nitroreductase [Chelatococcus asaccharovorans]CAH1663265.1 Chloronitrobenzene nitroreductase [Chelatococcus asaccharovorans]CAH1682869.1 Chloronitrobenzene nitroreductase [Chelatococcus asaccharovorans]
MSGTGAEVIRAAIKSRRSVRAFTNEAPPRSVIQEILNVAARAPSASNTQPWMVHVLQGAARANLTAAIMQVRAAGGVQPEPDYQYHPECWPEPYLDRRRTVGWALYEAVGIAKGDRAASARWHDRNFDFFGAAVGLIFTVDRRLGLGSLIDIGLYMQNVMIMARALGYDTCAQAAFAHYSDVIRAELQIPDVQMVVCGMALGIADHDADANRFETDRAPLPEFVTFHMGGGPAGSLSHDETTKP